MKGFHFDTIDSTNAAAKRMLGSGEIDADAYVTAREQTAGRGSRGRVWLSPRDAGLYLSVIHVPQPALPTDSVDLTLVTLAGGAACAEFLARFDAEIRLKPINDLIVDGRKLGGILTEAQIERGAVKALIVGIGINLRPADRILTDGGLAPICLAEATARDSDPDRAIAGVSDFARHVLVRVKFALAGWEEHTRQDWLHWAIPGAALPHPPDRG